MTRKVISVLLLLCLLMPGGISMANTNTISAANIPYSEFHDDDILLFEVFRGGKWYLAEKLYGGNNEQLRVACYDSNREHIWSYSVLNPFLSEIDMTNAFLCGTESAPKVAVINSADRLIQVDAATGIVEWELSSADCAYGLNCFATAVDEAGTMYLAGYYGDSVVAVNMNGEMLWQQCIGQPNDSIMGVRRLEIKGDELLCYVEGTTAQDELYLEPIVIKRHKSEKSAAPAAKADGTEIKDAPAIEPNYTDLPVEQSEKWAAISAKYRTCLVLHPDGTVSGYGKNNHKQIDVGGWTGIISVAAGGNHSVGLKADGTVIAAGSNEYGQCEVGYISNVEMIAAGYEHTVCLLKDGRVLAFGNNDHGQCNVAGWTDIALIYAGDDHTVGVRKDGTVVAVGKNGYGQCDVGHWRDIVSAAVMENTTVGIRADGTIVYAGDNHYGQCDLPGYVRVASAAGAGKIMAYALEDGRVLCCGENGYGEGDTANWANIKEISCGEYFTIGLTEDGVVCFTGWSKYGENGINFENGLVR